MILKLNLVLVDDLLLQTSEGMGLSDDAKPAMVCTANDLHGWKDFPKGLRVLLLERDSTSASEIRAKLEAMDYHVSTFYDENEALSEISNRLEGFHVAIVEVSTSSSQRGFKFLESAKDLPTIMTSDTQCLSTMMKCIALGAVEFLCKPLSEDKLRNIWQHVVHKAFNAGASVLSESLKPVKESVESMLQLQTENGHHESKISIDLENISRFSDNYHEQSAGSDKYPAPSTPQLKQGARLLDDGDCQEHTNCSNEKESGEHEGESKSVEASSENLNEGTQPQKPEKETLIKQEEDFVADGSNGESTVPLNPHDRRSLRSTNGNITSPNKAVVLSDTCQNKANRKKLKVDWTPALHKKFVQAVEQLGIDQAIPSRVLELMKVEGLTRHNVASHLQKYRLHKRQMMPKEEDRRWQNQRDTVRWKRPVMAYPPHHYNHGLSPPPVYPMWGQSGTQTTGAQFWGPPGYTWLQPTENWHWKPFPGVHVDAWGCPVLPATQAPYLSYTQADEVVDKVVKEAISKPWLPLPLGLKPPSTDSVLAELSRQGISPIPLDSKGSKPC
ncbi:two-component response regulator-like APRR2 isoform X2 [Arachis hypogaea]|uniref:two-component response regulator-like APRR2 isoform X2 n=2 Tax=Arachis hypogaea TaxID=3818 RepID=UPI000DED3419|nr:two-component response regulator-like APRR2 isoform X2 [Arachis hypogaea]XP_025698455.1 two-component response regulator-like APRR2 isoform X2 [Arachis hypogaea]